MRSYATNTLGTTYGTQKSFTAGIGAPYQGVIVAYILALGDPGYDANVFHGLIASTANQSEDIQWCGGVYPNYVYTTTGATGTAIGTGLANTNAIISIQGGVTTIYAAGLARAYLGGGYTDWYLPSKDELNKLYLNSTAIGGFNDPGSLGNYWSSSESSLYDAWQQFFFGTALAGLESKSQRFYSVQAIRSF